MNAAREVTGILLELDERPGAAQRLLPLVYDDLRALARSYFAAQPADHTLQPTALVHEAYFRLVKAPDVSWSGRAHFFAVAAKAMRQILVNDAEARQAHKRGGNRGRVSLSAAIDVAAPATAVEPERDVAIDALNAALQRLEALDERQARIVELRWFGGMTVAEVAHALNVSQSTVEKDWRMARLWLLRELQV
ncbi:MAG: sigma-70 family RNA polymerase sigma factor [Planctomycetota bacterium]|nr:MAG: sigma-70 family RNA polymerase sigma factor [Planctomycetota bacterium]